jgi:hypothetical protein
MAHEIYFLFIILHFRQPVGLEDTSKYPDLFERLAAHPVEPWTEQELQKLAGLNFLRVFREVERVCRHISAISRQLIVDDTCSEFNITWIL